MLTRDEILEAISKMNMDEMRELREAFEERFGLTEDEEEATDGGSEGG